MVRMNNDNMTLGQHAEAWYRDQGVDMPSDPDTYQKMYEAWVEWAFQGIGDEKYCDTHYHTIHRAKRQPYLRQRAI